MNDKNKQVIKKMILSYIKTIETQKRIIETILVNLMNNLNLLENLTPSFLDELKKENDQNITEEDLRCFINKTISNMRAD